MLIKKPKIDIDAKNPFKEDELKREESAEILTQFLQSIDEPFVLAIDSGWGKMINIYLYHSNGRPN